MYATSKEDPQSRAAEVSTKTIPYQFKTRKNDRKGAKMFTFNENAISVITVVRVTVLFQEKFSLQFF